MKTYRQLAADMADARNRHVRAQARFTLAKKRKMKAVEHNDKLEADIQSRINKLEALKKKLAVIQRSIARKEIELNQTREESASLENGWLTLSDQSSTNLVGLRHVTE